jgi:PhnB protein
MLFAYILKTFAHSCIFQIYLRRQFMSSTPYIPAGFHTLTPHITLRNAADAIKFYKEVFDAVEVMSTPYPQNNEKIMHAELRIGDSLLMINDEIPEMGAHSPQSLSGTNLTLHMYVPDVDAAFNRAVQAGAQVIMPVADTFWGDRYGMLVDAWGQNWALATRVREVTLEEMQQGAQAAFGG